MNALRLAVVVMCSAVPIFAQNSALAPQVRPTFFNSSGTIAGNGFLCTTQTGTNTSLLTYQDSALTLPNQNPIHLNGVGRAVNGSNEVSIFIQAQQYRFSIYAAGNANTCNGNPVGALLNQIDNVYDLALLYRASFATQLDDQICHASQYTGTPNDAGGKMAACIAALPSTGGIVDARGLQGPQTISTNIFNGVTKPIKLLLGSATYTMTGAQIISGNNSAIQCQGTTLLQQTGAGVTLWTFSGTDDTLEDCVITGTTAANSAVIRIQGTNTLIRHNTVNNLGSFGFYIAGASNPRIVNNSIFGVAGAGNTPVGIETAISDVHDLLIEGNRIDVPSGVSGGEPIQLSTSSTSDVGRVLITGNTLSTASGFCFEGGPFGGGTSAVHDITITGNSCTITANGASGGFSSGGGAIIPNKNIIFSNNVYNGGGFTVAVSAFEVSGAIGFAVTGNTIRNGSGTNTCVLSGGIADNGTITGNSCTGFLTTGTGISIMATGSTGLDRKLSISNNTVELLAGSGASGITVQCNNASAICRNISLTGNTVFADGTANSTGITVVNNAGVLENVTIAANSFYKTARGISISGINGLTITNNTYDAANASGIGITNNTGLTNFNIGHNVITSLNAGVVAYTVTTGINLGTGPYVDGVISDNQISGVNLNTNTQGIQLLNSTTGTMARVSITGNMINGQGSGQGIQVACTNAAGTCQDVSVEGNNITGDKTAGGSAVNLFNSGTMQRVAVSSNQIQSYDTAITLHSVGTPTQIMNNSITNCNGSFSGLGSNVLVVDFNGTTLASVPTTSNGSVIYVSDSTIANPCAGGGTGAILKRLNGVNVCN